MNRKLRNIVMVIILIMSLGSLVFTGYVAYNNLKKNEEIVDNSYRKEPPEKPEGEMGEPPEGEEPPEKPDGEPPEKPDGEQPEKPDGELSEIPSTSETIKSNSVTIIYYILFGIEALVFIAILIYLIMSEFNYKYLDEVFASTGSKLLFVILSLIISCLISFGSGLIVNKLIVNHDSKIVTTIDNNEMKNNEEPPEKPDGEMGEDTPPKDNDSSATSSGVKEIVSEEEITSDLESSKEDESVVLVKDGGTAKISGIKLNKSGDATNTESTEFKGVNSGVLVEKGNAEITDSNIKTNAKASNAVFATGEDSKITIKDSTIETSGTNGSRGLDATYGGTIEADNVKITTKGASSATLATDRGEGTVTVTNSELTTNGKGSPVIYSTGNISITDCTGSANGSQMVVIEGKNSANITSSSLIASGIGNRNNVDNSGIMIYQSMSGDASVGKGVFNAADSFLEIASNSSVYKTAPMFLVTNTTADINLKNTKLTYGSNILLSVVATSEWGKSGSNGGIANLNAINQSLKGNIIVDNISELEINLTNSTYRGTINGANSAKKIVLKLDADSKITLTGDSYVDVLENANSVNGNIDFNGYKLYVNGSSIR